MLRGTSAGTRVAPGYAMAGTMLSAHTRLVPALRRADTRAKTEPRPAGPDHERLDSTSPYPRTFEAHNEGRESLPYLELEIATEPQDTLAAHVEKRPPLRVVKTVSRKIGIGTGPEQALPTGPAASKAVDPEAPTEAVAKLDPDERPTNAIAKQAGDELDDLATTAVAKQDAAEDKLEPSSVVDDELDLSTARVVKMLAALAPPAPSDRPSDHARPDSETAPNGPAPRPSRLQWLGVVLTQPEVGAALMIGTWLRPEFCVTSPVTHVVPRGDGVLVQTTTKSRYFVGPSGDTYLVRRAP